MTSHLVLPYGHAYLRYMSRVIHQTLHFLHKGVFKHE
jgi:hypothetical protein